VTLGRPIGCEVLVEVFADERREPDAQEKVEIEAVYFDVCFVPCLAFWLSYQLLCLAEID
jgi:hypothetical protein